MAGPETVADTAFFFTLRSSASGKWPSWALSSTAVQIIGLPSQIGALAMLGGDPLDDIAQEVDTALRFTMEPDQALLNPPPHGGTRDAHAQCVAPRDPSALTRGLAGLAEASLGHGNVPLRDCGIAITIADMTELPPH